MSWYTPPAFGSGNSGNRNSNVANLSYGGDPNNMSNAMRVYNNITGNVQAARNTGTPVGRAPSHIPLAGQTITSWNQTMQARQTAQSTGTAWGSKPADTTKFDPTSGVDWQKKYYDDLKTEGYRSAAATLRSAFEAYGLGGLSSTITGYIMDGKPASEVSILLRQTPQYKERFPAMDTLAKNGRAITEGEYIGLETNYNKILSGAGLNGYFKSPNDYAQYIAKDISPEEFASRVNTATTFVNNSNPNAVEMFKNYYGINKEDLLRYYLDPEKAAPELLKKASIATVGGAAAAAGLDIGESYARNITDAGAAKNAPEAFAKVAQTKEELAKLAAIEGGNVTTGELVGSALSMDVNATKKVQGLASQERARFAGKSAGTAVTGSNVSGSY